MRRELRKGSQFLDLIIESDSCNEDVTEDIMHEVNGKSVVKGDKCWKVQHEKGVELCYKNFQI